MPKNTTEFDYQAYMRENAPDPSTINRGTKAREKRLKTAKTNKSTLNMTGQLFTHYFLTDGIKTTPEWQASVEQSDGWAAYSILKTVVLEPICRPSSRTWTPASNSAPSSWTGEERRFDQTECAFFLHDTKTVHDKDRCFPLTPDDFARVNPNTGTAPVFRSQRDAEITRGIYEQHPVLVDRSQGKEQRVWPMKYTRISI